MLNSLLKLSKTDRNKLILKLKLETKRHLFDSIYTMTEELGLDAVPDFETRVKMRYELIKKFPDTVFWDYAECANIKSGIKKTDSPDFEIYPACKVSTNGDVIVFNKIKRLFVYPVEPTNRYGEIKFSNGSRTRHRLIASTFIPKPERLKDIPYAELQVNHIDLTCWNNRIENLEWVTDKENQRHRYSIDRYEEEKYFLFIVAVDNGFLGREFVLSEHDLSVIGTDFIQIRKVMSRDIELPTYKGFAITLLHRDNIKDAFIGLPDDIAELLNTEPRYFDVDIKPVIGTVLKGRYKGFEFSLFGATEVNRYFNRAHVEAVTRGKLLSHSGCTFRRCSPREAIPLHGKLTKEIAEDFCSPKILS